MKKIFCLVSMALILLACAKKGEYKVTGTVEDTNLNGKSVYLSRYNARGIEKSDTAVIKDGKFEFQGIQENPVVYYVSMDETEGGEITQGVPLLLQSGNLWVKIHGNKTDVGGSPEIDAYQKMMEAQRPLIEKMQSVDDRYRQGISNQTMTSETQADLEKEVEVIYEQVRNIASGYILKNMNNPLGEEVFMSHMQLLTPEEKDEALSKASEAFKSTPEMKEILAAMEFEKKVAVGQKFTDFSLPDIEGKETALSAYAGKGKYVLLDFWASWCQPCVKEMPTLVQAYQFYQGKNFEIVGVSLDQEKDSWLSAVKKLNITWPQLSDLQGAPLATQPYLVRSIPHTILIDPQGTIIAKDLRGAALLEKLEEVLK